MVVDGQDVTVLHARISWTFVRWATANLMWMVAWALVVISAFHHGQPWATWGVFVGLGAAVLVGWLLFERTVERVAERERLGLEQLADSIAKAMAQQQGVRRL